MRQFNNEEYKGLFFAPIPHKEVNASLRGAAEGDIFYSPSIGYLIYYDYGFKINTNNGFNYLSKEDLKHKFINLAQVKRNEIRII